MAGKSLGWESEDGPPPDSEETGFNAGLEAEVDFSEVSREWAGLKKVFDDPIRLEGGKVKWRGEVIRENFEKGGKFTMRLGETSETLLGKLAAKPEASGFCQAMAGQGPLTVTEQWLDRKRKGGSDHRAHFTFMPDCPDSKPLSLGDIELIPSIWRNPDRVFDAGKGCIALETDAIDGDVFRLIVKVQKGDGGRRGNPDVKTFYRSIRPYPQNKTVAPLGAAAETSRFRSLY